MTWKEARRCMLEDAQPHIENLRALRQIQTDFRPSKGIVAEMRKFEKRHLTIAQNDKHALHSK